MVGGGLHEPPKALARGKPLDARSSKACLSVHHGSSSHLSRSGLQSDQPSKKLDDGASLPTDTDLFRLGNYSTVLIGTDRFKDAVEQGGWTGISFRELPVR